MMTDTHTFLDEFAEAGSDSFLAHWEGNANLHRTVHTASLVPGDPVLHVEDMDVALSGPYQGRRRMTLMYPVINRARRVLWVVTGSEKTGMLNRLLNGTKRFRLAGFVKNLKGA